jgi:hypothetical protein
VSDTDPRRVIHATVRKGNPIQPTYLTFDQQTLTASLGETVTDEAVQKRKIDKAQKSLDLDRKILQFVSDNPGLPKWTLAGLVGGRGKDTGDRIDALIDAGFIDSRDAGGNSHARRLYPLESDAAFLLGKVKGGEHAYND